MAGSHRKDEAKTDVDREEKEPTEDLSPEPPALDVKFGAARQQSKEEVLKNNSEEPSDEDQEEPPDEDPEKPPEEDELERLIPQKIRLVLNNGEMPPQFDPQILDESVKLNAGNMFQFDQALPMRKDDLIQLGGV